MRLLALTLVAVASLLATTGGQAQGGGEGSLAAPSTALAFIRVQWGVQGEVKDDCLYVKLNGDPGYVAPGDVRITKCQTRKAGTLVAAADPEVASTQASVVVDLTLSYVDLDSTGAFSPGDAVYADTDPAPGLAPTLSNTSFSLRLTPQPPDLTAGTMVRSYERDANAATVNLPPSSFGFVDGASGSGGIVDASDAWFILPGTATGATGAVPPGSVRLRNDGPFGTLTPAASSTSSSSTSDTASDTGAPSSTQTESSASTSSTQAQPSTSSSPGPGESSTHTSTEPAPPGNGTTDSLTDTSSPEPAQPGSTSPSILGESSKEARGSGFGPMFALAAVGTALLLARRKL